MFKLSLAAAVMLINGCWGTVENQGFGTVTQVDGVLENYQDVESWIKEVNAIWGQFNVYASKLTWLLSLQPTDEVSEEAMRLGLARNDWKNKVCDSVVMKEWLTEDQKRQLYLLCRGPRYTQDMAEKLSHIAGKLFEAYNKEICFSNSDRHLLLFDDPVGTQEQEGSDICLHGEPDLERIMRRTDLSPSQLEFIWTSWHDVAGSRLRNLYPDLVDMQNAGARNNGYKDMGEVWREELEIEDLEDEAMRLYEDIKPFYELLHAVIRHKLYQKYGPAEIDLEGPIPIHLLGNMWGQDWSNLISMIFHSNVSFNLEQNLKKKRWTVQDMVQQAEDMYTSMGFPKMTKKFWKYSVFEQNENTTLCHGTAANMYINGDTRMILCSKVTMQDFSVIHHEMGHLEYYMAYQDQPPIFQDGPNTAFHESIGDAVMHGVMTTQHLFRLGLITDEEMRDSPLLDSFLLFQQALTKIPEIPFALVLDKYRWEIFRGNIEPREYNQMYWKLNRKLRGVVPPKHRGGDKFDAGAKFHVSDNISYIRYFLSSIIQMQIFQTLCELSVYGRTQESRNTDQDYVNLPLNRCDIYGSKKAGKRLLTMMKLGASQHWSVGMELLTGQQTINTKALLAYYRPVYEWLKKYVKVNRIPVGW